MTQTKAQLVDLSVQGINANNLSSGTVPDARFPAVLPAISGANLTNLPSSNTGINAVVDDSSPELGGNLDVLTREITTSTSNGNIKLAPNGSGAVEIKGDGSSYEGCLQLNCHVNSHGVKIKSPDHSAGQSYTMVLPDNQIAADKFLKVKSITGSGATAVGQLEYSGVNVFEPNVLQESFHNDTAATSGTVYHDVLTYGMVYHSTANAGGVINFALRGDASTTFDSLISTGKVTTFTVFSPSNNASYNLSAFLIDGVSQSVNWSGGSGTPSATGSGIDVYSYTILKRAANTYSVYGNMTNFG
tara:strand:+ start:870 stop:1775 length:906 start_codon:yes stop_codon:yes gene_type:complete